MSNKQPTLIAYSVKELGKGKPSIWTKIGAAFAHEKGQGLTVQLDALPLSDRIVLREPKKDSDEASANEAGNE